jgi:hypothetical protein
MHNISLVLAACTALTLTACGDDGGSTAIDASVDSGGSLSCATYCDQIQTNCLDTAMNRQYVDNATCMAACATMPVGSPADTQGNTLGCRTYHSGVAGSGPNPAMSAQTHCPHAGPGGAGICGMNCAGFCQIVMGACTDANQAYADLAECMTTCGTFATETRYNTQVQTGASLACKLYHATVATTDPATHCPHVMATGGPCSPPL